MLCALLSTRTLGLLLSSNLNMAPNNRWFRSSVFVVASILGIGLFLSARDQRATFNQVQRERQVNDEWQRIAPSKSLVWKECGRGRQCARFIVPLDYSNPDGEEAIIALARKPAAVPRDSKSYRGPILLNPGGPGGSGVGLIMGQGGDLLSTIVGPEFDLVGFDPRGIARSTPRISFFKTDIERHLFNYASSFLVNNSDEGIHRTLARAKLVGQLAAESDSGYLRHMNTDHTARDMLRIVEAHGRSKIQYWGFSYGTILGATFAAMFPDKIERMVIDGVFDAEDYYASDRFLTITLDTDKVLDGFFTECAQAGPDNCQFWAPTATHIRRNLTSIFESIRYRPISVKTDSTYGLLDYSKLKQTIFATLYNPYVFFPSLAKALAELVTGNGSTLYTLIPDSIVPECQCDPELSYTSDTDASIAIICNDGEEILEDIDALENHLESSMKISQWGDVMAGFRLNCLGWPKYPKEQFRGPFKGKTSHPMLIIGNTADPVTPLWSARNVSRSFEGSVVLQQNSLGHCSLSAPSPCTQQYVRKYFVDGTLPSPGTVCEPIGEIFPVTKSRNDIDYQEMQGFFDESASNSQEFVRAVVDLSRMNLLSRPF